MVFIDNRLPLPPRLPTPDEIRAELATVQTKLLTWERRRKELFALRETAAKVQQQHQAEVDRLHLEVVRIERSPRDDLYLDPSGDVHPGVSQQLADRRTAIVAEIARKEREYQAFIEQGYRWTHNRLGVPQVWSLNHPGHIDGLMVKADRAVRDVLYEINILEQQLAAAEVMTAR